MISDSTIAQTVRLLLASGAFARKRDTAVLLYDLEYLCDTVERLRLAFPATATHAVAVKANPLKAVLTLLADRGCGFEVASLPELALARAIGAPAAMIAFDSPAKTIAELETAIDAGCHINIDSLEELSRVDALLRRSGGPGRARFGLRINPQVGTGAIAATSVAGVYSKFGIPMHEFEDALLAAYRARPWLRGVHVHVGSQGCPVELLVKGTAAVYRFAERLNAECAAAGGARQIDIFDIGGGLPVSYWRERSADSFAAYAIKLRDACPLLFSPHYRLITEFGRHIHANAGWLLSAVEYVKPSAEIDTAVIHVGADMFLRECYRPDDWHHDLAVLNCDGQLKSGPTRQYNIAGPLCFSGDLVARNVALPAIEEGDFVVIRDAGAYTLSMWSRYNSRQMPLVLGYRAQGNEFTVLRKRETVEDLLAFWA